MPTEFFQKNINRLDEIYSQLITGETEASEEVELRVEIIDILSSLQAAVISNEENNKDFIRLLENVRDNILDWDPQGHWFRHQKELIDSIYEVIVQAKNVVLTKGEKPVEEASKLKQELNTLKAELNDLRNMMSELIREKAASKSIETESDSIPKEIEEEKIETEKILPIEEGEKEKQTTIEVPEEKITIEEFPETKASEIESVQIDKLKEDDVDESLSFATKTAAKLAQQEKSNNQTSVDLDKMKAILTRAEEETKKQIESFKEKLLAEKKEEDKIKEEEEKVRALKEEVTLIQKMQEEITDQEISTAENETEEQLVKPSEVIRQQQSLESEETSSQDPYMQLLTLEAEKYRLEKAIEKNETDFQEGLKSKIEFDESIQIINKELAIIREKINSLRKKLTA